MNTMIYSGIMSIKYKQKKNELVEICYAYGLVINPKWPWLGCSPDALILDAKEKYVYGAEEMKCPASKADMYKYYGSL